MKTTIYLFAIALIGFVTIAAIPENDEKIKVTVVKHRGMETTVLDTSFDASSGYTVEQFLRDNGLDPEQTEIVDTDAFDGKYTWKRNDSFLFLNGSKSSAESVSNGENVIIETIVEFDEDEIEEKVEEIIEEAGGEDEVVKEIFVIKKDDGNGETTVTTTTIINGEKLVEEKVLPAGEVVFIDKDGNTEVELKEVFQELELEFEDMEFDFKELEEQMKEVEINFEELSNQIKTETSVIINGEKIDFDKIAKEGEGFNYQYIVEGPWDSPDQVTIIAGSKNSSDDHNVFAEARYFNDQEYTVAIVSRTSTEEAADEETQESGDENSFIADEVKLPIEGPFYYPNPTAGQFRLEFFLPERGQTQIQVFDMQGRMVYEDNLGNFQGAYNEEIDLNNLEPGTYVLNIMQNNLRLAEKLIVN